MNSLITLEKAIQALRASEAKANELGVAVSTAIVDDYGVLLAFTRMDGALHISPKFSQSKARTSASLGLPSESVASYAGEGKPYYGINVAFGGELMVIAGGLPIKENGKVIGGIGVGGSLDVNQDAECAKAGLAAFENTSQ